MHWLKRVGAALGMAVGGAIVIWIFGSLALVLMERLGDIIPGQVILGVAVLLFVVILIADWAIDERQKRELEDFNRRNGIQ